MKRGDFMKILLCCKAGVSCNMFASTLKDEADKQNLDVVIWATPETAIEYSIKSANLILITPQIASSIKKVKDLANPNTPIYIISDDDFQSFNAKKVLEEALAKYNTKNI